MWLVHVSADTQLCSAQCHVGELCAFGIAAGARQVRSAGGVARARPARLTAGRGRWRLDQS